MNTRNGVTTSQAVLAVVVIILLGLVGYFAVSSQNVSTTTISGTVTQTATSTAVSTATSTALSTVISTVGPTTSTAPPVVAPPLIVQRNAQYSDADPRDTSSIDVAQQSYETLTYLSPNGTVLPGLATAWNSINGSTWQYTLRQGVTFHDGTTFNATDVIYSITNTIAWGGGDAPDV